jgi:hypothetical protein
VFPSGWVSLSNIPTTRKRTRIPCVYGSCRFEARSVGRSRADLLKAFGEKLDEGERQLALLKLMSIEQLWRIDTGAGTAFGLCTSHSNLALCGVRYATDYVSIDTHLVLCAARTTPADQKPLATDRKAPDSSAVHESRMSAAVSKPIAKRSVQFEDHSESKAVVHRKQRYVVSPTADTIKN